MLDKNEVIRTLSILRDVEDNDTTRWYINRALAWVRDAEIVTRCKDCQKSDECIGYGNFGSSLGPDFFCGCAVPKETVYEFPKIARDSDDAGESD